VPLFRLIGIETDQRREAIELAFRSIETLASDMLRKIEAGEFPLYEERHTEAGAATNAPRSVAPQEGGRSNPMRMGNSKKAGAEAPAVGQEVSQTRDKSSGGGNPTLLSTRKHMLTVLPAASASRHVSSARPTRCVGSHLKLVWNADHAGPAERVAL